MSIRSRFKSKPVLLFVMFFAIVALIAISYGAYTYVKNQSDDNDETGNSEYDASSKQLEKVREETGTSIENYAKNQQEELEKQSSTVNTVDDLKKLEADKQGIVGLAVANRLISEGQQAEANEFINFVMLRDDSYGIDASRLCYAQATNDSAKAVCFKRANEQALTQEIIKQGESLPADYLEPEELEQG